MRTSYLFAAILCACSGSEESKPTATADTGAPVTDSAADAELVGHKCGSPPYVKWSGKVIFNDVSGEKPASGAKLTSPACPDQSLTIGEDGTFSLLLTKGSKSFARLERMGALNTILGEWGVEKDESDIEMVMLPPLFAGLTPDWDSSTEPAVLLSVSPRETATGACAAKDGVSFVVKDQPTAVVSYFSDASVPSAVMGATATTARGLVTFTNVTGTSIEVVGTKAGCNVSTITRLQTGKIIIEPKYITTLVAYVTNG